MNTKAIVAIGVVAILLAGSAAAVLIFLSNGDDDLPAKFDQRDKGIVTPVKYQNPWGTCWSFGSTGAAETSVLTYLGMTAKEFKEKEGYDLDFSEKHLAWFALNAVTESETDSQIGEGFMLVRETDYHYIYDNGGKATMAASLYSTGVGPVLEVDLFRYMGENGITAADYFRGENVVAGITNTKIYLDFFAKDQLNDDLGYLNYLQTIEADKLDRLLDIYRSWGVALDPNFDAEYVKSHVLIAYETLASKLRDYYIDEYTAKNQYSDMDNWAIPLGTTPSQRNYTAGYTMINGNSLLQPCTVNDNDEWTGLNDARMDLIKKELYAGHGMGMSYYYDAETLNKETWAQFNASNDRLGVTNHAIQVVGWDDNYSKDNFIDKPEKDGAWLCKNSWGSETDYDTATNIGKNAWGIKNDEGKHTGYFWISYCDRSINRIISYEFGKAPADEFNAYVYDYLPSHREKTLNSEDVLKTANVFTIGEAKEKLESVSIKTGYPGSDVKVSVYRLNDGFANPTDGTLLWETEKSYTLEGFHRIIVDKDVEMTAGQKIAVVVEEKNSYYKEGKTMYIADYNFGYDKEKAELKDDSPKAIYCETKVNAGESFLLMDGKWIDWHTQWELFKEDDGDMIDNFRIKMFTVDVTA